MPSLTTGVLLLLSATLHVCGRKDDIFRVTEEVVGLKRSDFIFAGSSQILVKEMMREDIQMKLHKIREEFPSAANFIWELILTARSVALDRENEREALEKLKEHYQILPQSAKKGISKYFPKLPEALNVAGNHDKPLSDGAPKNATEELELARAYLEGLSLPEKYKDVYTKINDLLTMDPKVWNEENLKEALKSLLNGIEEAIAATGVQDTDFREASRFLVHLCRAFTHIGGCNIAIIEDRLNGVPESLAIQQKLQRLRSIIELQIHYLEDRR